MNTNYANVLHIHLKAAEASEINRSCVIKDKTKQKVEAIKGKRLKTIISNYFFVQGHTTTFSSK